MKVEIKNEAYKFITDNSQDCDEKTAFLLTEHNRKYKRSAEELGCKYFVSPQELYKKWNLDDVKIIGVTGTNGKTTITNIIAHILKKLGEVVAVSGTEGVFLHSEGSVKKIAERTLTTPEIFTNLNNIKIAKENGARFFVMEVGSHGIHQGRVQGLKFHGKIFINLTQDHLDYHKTMEEYASVKSSFFQDDESLKIINIDDDWIQYNKNNSLTYSLKNKDADIFAENIKSENGISAEVFFEEKKYNLKSELLGKFNLYNLLASLILVKKITDFSMEEIIFAVADFSGVAGRMEILYRKGDLEVISDYAHTPDAIENVLRALKGDGLIFTIIGAGGDRDSSKRPIMASMACKNSNMVILTSDNPRNEEPKKILEDMEKGVEGIFDNYKIIVDRKEAIEFILNKVKEVKEKKVVVAILGKGDEKYIDIKGKKIPYSDRGEVKKYFK